MNMKRQISLDNYEIFLVDFLDGQLNDEQQAELMLFLEQHPHIQEELEGLEGVKLQPESISKPSFENLKKESPALNANQLDDYLIREMEEQLDDEEKKDLAQYMVDHPAAIKNRELIHKTRLEADSEIHFEHKDTLYKLAVDRHEPLSEHTIEEYMVAFHEGVLGEAAQAEVLAYIEAHPQWKNDFGILASIKMQADPAVVYEDKESLKHKAKIIVFNARTMNYVASLAAVLMVFFMFPALFDFSPEHINIPTEKLERQQLHIPEPITPQNTKQIGQKLNSSQQKEAKKTRPAKVAQNISNGKKQASTLNPKQSKKLRLEKVNARQPEIQFAQVEINKAVKPEFCYASESVYTGYYEVTAQKDNFLNQNPTLKRRLVHGFRDIFNIDPKEIGAQEDKLTVWDIADAGLKGINTLTENDMTLSRR
jgi:hypothetical protein